MGLRFEPMKDAQQDTLQGHNSDGETTTSVLIPCSVVTSSVDQWAAIGNCLWSTNAV
jgi:hypothetical protein